MRTIPTGGTHTEPPTILATLIEGRIWSIEIDGNFGGTFMDLAERRAIVNPHVSIGMIFIHIKNALAERQSQSTEE